MLGRSAGLLALVSFLLAPSLILTQDVSLARILPRFPVGPPSTHLPVRIVHPPGPPLPPPGVFGLPQLVRAAGMIFSGTVTKIERHPATLGQSLETVAVTFHIENAIRGATSGRELTVTQWMGLWSSGQRYRVGEHVLLFLYPNSKLRLTSCVGGMLGHFAMDLSGQVLLTTEQLTALQRDPVLGGKPRARFSDFARAVRQANEEE